MRLLATIQDPARRAPRPDPPRTTYGVSTAAARPRPAPVAGATVSGLLTGCRSGRRPLPARGRHSDLGELHTPAASSGPGAGSTSVRKQRTTAACAHTSARIAIGRRLPLGIPRVRPRNRLDPPFVGAVFRRGSLPPPCPIGVTTTNRGFVVPTISSDLRLLWLADHVRQRHLGYAKAAELPYLPHLPQAVFVRLLGTHRISPFDLDEDELDREIGTGEAIGRA